MIKIDPAAIMPLTDAETCAVIKDYCEGDPTEHRARLLSSQYQISVSTIFYALVGAGLEIKEIVEGGVIDTPKRKPGRKRSIPLDAFCAWVIDGGHPVVAAARAAGISKSYAYALVREAKRERGISIKPCMRKGMRRGTFLSK